MSDATGKITWVPSALIDEYTPAGRDTPEAWMKVLVTGEPTEDGDEDLQLQFRDADSIVMTSFEEFETFVVYLNAQGDIVPAERCPFTVDMFEPDAAAPPSKGTRHRRANHFWCDDPELMGDFKECLFQFAEAVRMGWIEMHGETYAVEFHQCYQGDEVAFLINPDFSLKRL